MIKKILLTIIAVLIAGGALMIYGTYKAADDFVKSNEPQLRQYVQMDESAQNQYIVDHADEIISKAAANAKPEDKADMSLIEKTKNDPAVRKAVEDLGRAVMAVAILHSESIAQDLNAQLKAKFEQEKAQLGDRLAKYGEVLEQAESKFKAAQ